VAKPRYKQKQVVWAKVPDRNGVVKDQPRPVLIVLTHPTDKRAPLYGLGISTREDLDPSDPTIEMPWDAQTGSTTGLYKRCAVVLLWAVHVPQEAIAEVSGSVSDEFFEMVSRKMEEARFWKMQQQTKGRM
jgi:hypothetical protein